jgi:hypothetical protein
MYGATTCSLERLSVVGRMDVGRQSYGWKRESGLPRGKRLDLRDHWAASGVCADPMDVGEVIAHAPASELSPVSDAVTQKNDLWS